MSIYSKLVYEDNYEDIMRYNFDNIMAVIEGYNNELTAFDNIFNEGYITENVLKNIIEKFKNGINFVIGIIKKIIEFFKGIVKKIGELIIKFKNRSRKLPVDDDGAIPIEIVNNGNKETPAPTVSEAIPEKAMNIIIAKYTNTVPKQMKDDLEKCIHLLESRTADNCDKLINDVIKAFNDNINLYKLNANSKADWQNQYTDHRIVTEIQKVETEVNTCINSFESSSEYKRLQENKYKRGSLVETDLSNLQKFSKECEKTLSVYEDGLNKLNNLDTSKELDDTNENYVEYVKFLYQKTITMSKAIISLFKAKINVLDLFFKNIGFSGSKDPEISKFTTGIRIKPRLTVDKVKYQNVYIDNKTTFDKINEYMNKLKELNSDKKYSEYRKEFKDFIKLFNLQDNVNIAYDGNCVYNGTICANYSYLVMNLNKIPVGDKPLYHQGKFAGLSELDPSAIINGGLRYCPFPMIYVHVGAPSSRLHRNLDIDRDNKGLAINLYKVTSKIDFVYQDTEANATASIIPTDKPIAVKEIDYKDFKAKNNYWAPEY